MTVSLPTLNYDEWMLALCIWREARNQQLHAMRAIACVIRNRVRDRRWPDSIPAVITEPKQFSSFNQSDPNSTKFPQPERGADWAAFALCAQVAREPVADVVPGATHYHSLPPDKFPSWHQPEKVVAHIGPFYFLKL